MSVHPTKSIQFARLPHGYRRNGVVGPAASMRPAVGANGGRGCLSAHLGGRIRTARSLVDAGATIPELKLSWSISTNPTQGQMPFFPVVTGNTFGADTDAGRRGMR